MITIQHAHTDSVVIIYSNSADHYVMKEECCGSMDEIAEHVCEVFYNHDFTDADVCADSTGEVLMIIKRT